MTTAKFVQTDYTTQTASAYKANIDANVAVMARIAAAFAPRALDTPVMKVHVDAGHTYVGVTLTEVAAQDSGTITAPVGNPRIDRIVGDMITGAISTVTGTPAGSPAAPAIPAGKFPIAQVLIQTSSLTITNSMITDERWFGGGASSFTTEVTTASAATTDIGAAASNVSAISGVVTITSLGSSANTANPLFFVRFTGALTLTHHATQLILPQSVNITTVAGDAMFALYLGSGNWRVLNYFKTGQNVPALVNAGTSGGTANAQTLTPNPALGAYAAGVGYAFKVSATSTSGTVTLAVSGLATRNLKKFIGGTVALLGIGDLLLNSIAYVIDDGTQFILLNPPPYSQAADLASASTVDFSAATGDYGHITGTVTITALTLAQGRQFRVVFDGILTLTHNATSLILPGGASITTAAGDTADFRGEASGNVRCLAYNKKDGTSVVAPAVPAAAAQSDQETATSTTTYVSPGRQQFHPSASKCWGNTTGNTTPAIGVSYNTTSITDTAVGQLTVTIATDFSSVNYAINVSCMSSDAAAHAIQISRNTAPSATAFLIDLYDSFSVLADPSTNAGGYFWSTFGDQ